MTDRKKITPVDCIITTVYPNALRRYYYSITRHALDLAGIDPEQVMVIYNQSGIARHFSAEELSKSEFYIRCDDDVVPARPDDIYAAVELMRNFPDIGILGFAWKYGITKDSISGWCLGEYSASPGDLLEVDHVGGFTILRKGALQNIDTCVLPNYNKGIGDDMVICRAIRSTGLKVVLDTRKVFHHIGEGNSLIWNQK